VDRCEGKCQFAHTPGVGVVCVRLSAQGPRPPSGRGRSILLPAKTSLLVGQLFGQMFGRSTLNDRIGSQVDITHLVYICLRSIRMAMILSSFSLVLMVRNHLPWISFSLWDLSCITLSHLSTYMRCIDLAIRICKRQVAPLRALYLICSGGIGGSSLLFCGEICFPGIG
jgi:hypothetical protein